VFQIRETYVRRVLTPPSPQPRQKSENFRARRHHTWNTSMRCDLISSPPRGGLYGLRLLRFGLFDLQRGGLSDLSQTRPKEPAHESRAQNIADPPRRLLRRVSAESLTRCGIMHLSVSPVLITTIVYHPVYRTVDLMRMRHYLRHR